MILSFTLEMELNNLIIGSVGFDYHLLQHTRRRHKYPIERQMLVQDLQAGSLEEV